MKASVTRICAALLALLLSSSLAWAQSPRFSQVELDRMLAPIALYPDPLLSQILMASTYPLEVVQAARWSSANPGLRGDAAVRAAEPMDWDPSVKSMVAFPQVLAMMDEKLDWTEDLGEAFLEQEPQLMDTVQMLRQRAYAAGHLRSSEELAVRRDGPMIVLEPARPQVVYVPYYDPLVVYGPWWHPAPPMYWRPWPGYSSPSLVSFGFRWGPAVTISAGVFFGRFDWPQRQVVHHVYHVQHTRIVDVPRRWVHNPEHRRGAPYRSEPVRQRFTVAQRPAAQPVRVQPAAPRVESRRVEMDRREDHRPDDRRAEQRRAEAPAQQVKPTRIDAPKAEQPRRVGIVAPKSNPVETAAPKAEHSQREIRTQETAVHRPRPADARTERQPSASAGSSTREAEPRRQESRDGKDKGGERGDKGDGKRGEQRDRK